MNIKQGLRRIVLVLIIFCTIIATFIYFADNPRHYEYVRNITISNADKSMNIEDFIKVYNLDLMVFDFKCHPYLQYCDCLAVQNSENKRIRNDDFTVFSNLNSKIKLKVTMPKPFTYFIWQLKDLLFILIIPIFIYIFYLGIEYAFIWILNGFKDK